MNIFSRTKPIKALPLTQSLKLPRNFAEKVLELETSLNFFVNEERVSSLMQLYSVYFI